jgi:LacI family transcriptional regulator
MPASDRSPAATRNRVTIADIARESGVSNATVSLALRYRPGVGDETRRRILDVARELGYPVSAPARPLMSTMGVVIKTRPRDEPLSNLFYAPLVSGIEAFCRHNDINLVYAHLPVDEENNPLEPPRLIKEQHADGLLIVGAQLNPGVVEILHRLALPVVLVDAYAGTEPWDCVVTDNAAGAEAATEYLIALGHSGIAMAGSRQGSYPSIQERRAGYLAAMSRHGLAPRFADAPHEAGAAAEAAVMLLRRHPETTAVVAANDDVAIAVIGAAQAAGWRVPQDLSVIGFDNISLAEHVRPALTTMRVDTVGMGRLGAQLLANRVRHPEAARVRAILRAELIERHSVQALAEGDPSRRAASSPVERTKDHD